LLTRLTDRLSRRFRLSLDLTRIPQPWQTIIVIATLLVMLALSVLGCSTPMQDARTRHQAEVSSIQREMHAEKARAEKIQKKLEDGL